MAVLEVKDLCVTYIAKKKVEVEALRNVNATFESGINVLIGYSGCGKTTLLKCIAGLIDFDGQIFLDGVDIDTLPVQARNVSFVSQQYVLYPHLTVFDNIAFPLKNLKAPREEIIRRVNEIAEIFNLKACLSQKPKYISGGQQQRVALARALVKRPKICLLDEPLSNVDAPSRVEARAYIKNAIESLKTTAIYVTHDFQEAMSIADKIFVIDDKKIEISGTPLKVFNSCNPVVNSLKAGTYEI